MQKPISFLLSVILCTCFSLFSFGFSDSCAAESPGLISPGTICSIAGKHSVLGEYKGALEVRQSADGRLNVIRTVIFDTYRYESRRVRELWSGEGRLQDGRLSALFQLKSADLFDCVDGIKRSGGDFKKKITVPYSVLLKEGSWVSAGTPSGSCADILGPGRPAGSIPLWKDERTIVPAYGDCFQIIGKLAMSTIFLPVAYQFRNSSLAAPYVNRPEFKTQKQFFVIDRTDFAFLRKNPDVICVDNKVVDKISLAEESLRSDAYGPTLYQKACFFENDMQNNHLNELGLFSGRMAAAGGKQIFVANGDGALWSGMYAGSQAMRWLATGEPQALANFKRVTRGLMLLMDLTGDGAEFARTAEIAAGSEQLSREWSYGVHPYEKIKYVRGGNNDMIKGLFHAFAWAYEVLPPDDPMLKEVSNHVRRLANLRVVAHEATHPGNCFSASGLIALDTGRKRDLDRYLSFYNTFMKPIDALNLDKGFFYGGMADWSGINLGMVSQITDILVAKNLANRCASANTGDRESLVALTYGLRRKLLNSWAIYANARRDFLTVAADAFAFSDVPVLKFPNGSRPQTWCRQSSWAIKRGEAVWLLDEIPMTLTSHYIHFDYRLRPEWCASAWPRLPWKAYTESPPMEYHLQGAYDYSAFQGAALDSDNLFTSAFQYSGQCSGTYHNGRADYLHVYWMGRLSGLIDPDR